MYLFLVEYLIGKGQEVTPESPNQRLWKSSPGAVIDRQVKVQQIYRQTHVVKSVFS